MGEGTPRERIPYAEYLVREIDSPIKHEWYDGRTYAMAGGTLAHSRLAARMTAELLRLADACGCAVFNADGRVRVPATGRAAYPDVSVVCGEVAHDDEDPDAIVNPTVIVEVLSDTTERDDRGEKFHHYRRMESLLHYVRVSQHEARIEVFTRGDDPRWSLAVAEKGEHVSLDALRGTLSVDDVYRGVALSQRA